MFLSLVGGRSQKRFHRVAEKLLDWQHGEEERHVWDQRCHRQRHDDAQVEREGTPNRWTTADCLRLRLKAAFDCD